MKKAICLLLLFTGLRFSAQMAGAYTIPGSFTSIAAAVASLNSVGISGSVVVNIQAGYTESITAPITLTATGTAANPIIFQKSGSGANPLITGYTGVATPSSAVQDGMWALVGSDYITIDGIDLLDPNTTNPATMEYGYGLFKGSTTNGARNNTIKNCVITLSRNNNAAGVAPFCDGSRGINAVNALITAQTTSLTATTVNGGNSNNVFYTNTIQNCNIGIALIGFAPASATNFNPADHLNDVGGTSAATGNSIINFGGGGTTSAAAGIQTLSQYEPNIAFNTISNNNGSGINHAAGLRGIYLNTSKSSDAAVLSNTISLISAGTTAQVSGIENASGSPAASNTVNISNNVISNCFFNSMTTGEFDAILSSSTPDGLMINSNIIADISGSGPSFGIKVTGATGTGCTIYKNKIYGFSLTSAGSAATGISISAGSATTIFDNLIGGLSTPNAVGASALTGISLTGGTTNNVYYNTVYLNSASTSTLFGSSAVSMNATPNTQRLRNNIFINLSASTGTGVTVASRRTSTVLTNYVTASNNNLFYAGTPGASNLIFSDGTNQVQTLAAYKTLMSTRDGQSITENANFVSTTGANANFLNINSVIPTQIESGAAAIATFTDDYAGTARNASTPDIGAWEGAYTLNDMIPPVISGGAFTTAACNPASRTLTVTLTDPSGVASGTAAPRAYYSVNGAAYASVQGTLSSGTASTGVWSFNFAFTAVSTNTISWYVVAQDVVSASNLASLPSAGFSGTDVNSVTTPPTTPNSYTVANTSGGSVATAAYSLCAGQTLTLNSTGASSGASYSYQWQIAPTAGGTYSNLTTGSGGTTTTYQNNVFAPGVYYLKLQTTCVSTTVTGSSNEVTVTVNATPGASATASPAFICAGSNLNLSGSSNFGTIYAWTGPNSFTSALQNPTITAATSSATGNYFLTVSAAGCSSTSILPIVVGIPPTAITVTPSSATVCSNSSQTLAVTGGGGIPLQWNWGTNTATNTASSFADTDYPAPYTLWYGGQKMQVLILASELTAAGFGPGSQLSSVQFPVVSLGSDFDGTLPIKSFRVSMGHTSLTSISAFQTGLTVVKTAANYTPSVGYGNTHAFTTVFTWDGTSNVIMETTFSNNIIGSATKAVIQYHTSTPFQSCIVDNEDSYTVNNMANSTFVDYSYFARPDFKLNGTALGTYSWSPATGLSSATNPTVAATPTAAIIYTVSYTNGGCAAVTTTVDLAVAPSPTLSITSPTSLCNGSTATLSANGAGSYTWTPGAFTTSDIAVSPTSNTTYTLKGSVGSCTASLTKSIAVLARPTVSATISSTVACSGYPVTLSGSGASTYSWTGGVTDGVPFAAGGATSYTVTGTNTAGCSNTAVKTISINPSPTINLTGTSGLCIGQTASISATGADSYTWNTGATTSSIVDTPPASTVYVVTGVNASNGCTTSATQSVNVALTLSIAISGPSLICQGQTASLTASGGVTYTWSTSDQTSTLGVSPSSNISYSVTGASGTCSNTAVKTISVNPSPTLAISGTTVVCPGQTLALSGSGATTYTWSNAATTSSIVLTPAAAAVYTVTGTNTVNCSSTATAAVALYTVPVVTIAQSATIVCLNTPATFTATGANSYTWSNGPTTFTNVVTPTGTTTYTVTGINSQGCTATKTVAVATRTLPVISVSPASPTICSTSGTNLTASGAGTSGTYSWTGGPATAAYSVSPSATTVYTVAGTNSLGCAGTKTVAVTTNSLPVIGIASSAGTVCSQSPVSYTASGASTYTWANSLGSATMVTAYPANSTTYSVTGTNPEGCNTTATVAVTTLSLPVISVTPVSPTVCANEPSSFTASGASTYTWDNGATVGSTAAITPTGSSSYSVSGTDPNGCVSGALFLVFTTPQPVLAISASAGTVCSTAPVSFTASGADTYSWSNGGASNSSVTYSPSGASTYTVTGTNTITGCIGTQTVSVATNSLPIVVISPASPSVCSHASLILSASGASTYVWSTTSINNSITITPTANVTYTLTGTDDLGCSNSQTVAVTAYALPVLTAPSLSICLGETATYTISGAVTYTWNGSTTGATYTVSPALSAVYIYTVSGTDNNSCVNKTTVSLDVNACVGIKTNSFSENLVSVYPNPSTGAFTAKFDFAGEKTVLIMDVAGKVISQSVTSSASQEFNLSEMAKGVYFVRISTKDVFVNYKLIIE